MNKQNTPEVQEQPVPSTEEQEKKRHKKFLDRLRIFQNPQKLPIRTWLAWAGVILFVALVIAYYVVNGG